MVCMDNVNDSYVIKNDNKQSRRKIVKKKKSKLNKLKEQNSQRRDKVQAMVNAEFSALKALLTTNNTTAKSEEDEELGALEDPLDVVLEAIRHIQSLEKRLGSQASREAFLLSRLNGQ